MNKYNTYAISVYKNENLVKALQELRKEGFKISTITEKILIEYIKKNHKEIAEKYNL